MLNFGKFRPAVKCHKIVLLFLFVRTHGNARETICEKT